MIADSDRHNVKDCQGRQRQGHAQWQQTFDFDARRGTTASGSCWCSSRESSCSLLDYRTAGFAETVHAKTARYGRWIAESAPAMAS